MVFQVVHRLVMFAPIARWMHSDKVQRVSCLEREPFNWRAEVEPLTEMPVWAVDKHTYRGRFGKETPLERNASTMSDEQFREFHGPREKRGIETFFSEGTICAKQSLLENPLWEQTKEITLSYQHTQRMTKKLYDSLKVEFPRMFRAQPAEAVQQPAEAVQQPPGPPKGVKRKNTDASGKGDKKSKKQCLEEGGKSLPGPLLQVPTGAAKVYTRADLEACKVIKGPYKNEQTMNRCMFLNKVMRDVLHDPHTMECELNAPYISFPLVQGSGATMAVTKRDFTDRIAKKNVKDAEFITREAMGIVQLHKLSPTQVSSLPVSFLAHFAYRFALNVGDSGLYNAITDADLSFVYGIDITEKRGPLKKDPKDILGVLFTHVPRKQLCCAILQMARAKKVELLDLVSIPVDFPAIEALAAQYHVAFDRNMFVRHIDIAKRLVTEL